MRLPATPLRPAAGAAAVLVAGAMGCAAAPPFQPLSMTPPPQGATTLYLVGDAGAVDAQDPLLAQLREDVRASAAVGPTLVAFLGDNVYPSGVRASEPDLTRDTLILSRQLAAVAGTGARALFMPGNHDWDEGSADGLAALARQEAYFAAAAASGAPVDFLPRGGCPGPEVVELPGVRLVLVDTQWFIHDHRRGCPARTPEAVAEAVTGALDGAGDRDVLLLTHHPLRTHGPHGGHFTLRSHLFPLTDFVSWAYVPLPVLGSAYVVARQEGITDQDLAGDQNEEMRALLEGAMREAASPPLLAAAGHEHSLQVLPGGPRGPALHLVSGAGSKSTPVDAEDGALLAASVPGYMKVEFTPGGARVSVVPVRDAGDTRAVGWCGVVDRESREVAACR